MASGDCNPAMTIETDQFDEEVYDAATVFVKQQDEAQPATSEHIDFVISVISKGAPYEALAKLQTKSKSKTVETYLITCNHCGYSWCSAIQSVDRMSCGRCRGRFKVPDEIHTLNASRRLD